MQRSVLLGVLYFPHENGKEWYCYLESHWWIQIGLLAVDEGVSENEDKKISPGRATITGATVITWELSEDGEMMTFCDVIAWKWQGFRCGTSEKCIAVF